METIPGAFDEIVVVDTGSKDRTVAVFEEWAQGEVAAGRLTRYATDTFRWIDDFSAARAYADTLVNGDIVAWADADDQLVGAQNLRAIVTDAPEQVHAWVFNYNYAQDPNGNCVCALKRERLVRAGKGTWVGRVHEAQVFTGQAVMVPAEQCEWVHRKQHKPNEPVSPRNLRILRKWVKDEPQNPRVLGYLGTEELARGRVKQAATFFRRYLKLKTGWDEERAQIHRKLSVSLMAQGKHEDAIKVALEALDLLPAWPDSHLTLAEANFGLDRFDKAAEWARQVIARGVPDTMLIINPLEYLAQPRAVLAGALGSMGDLDGAITVGEEALSLMPYHQGVAQGMARWRGARKRESSANTVCSLAEVLIQHDEQLKALEVLKAAPYYCTDHPRVVALRSQLRERVDHLFSEDGYADHYTTGGSRPEDFVEDYMAVGDALPRCGFLLAGLTEQAAA